MFFFNVPVATCPFLLSQKFYIYFFATLSIQPNKLADFFGTINVL